MPIEKMRFEEINPPACPPKAALPNKTPKLVPGIPKPAAANKAALPIGDLTIFLID